MSTSVGRLFRNRPAAVLPAAGGIAAFFLLALAGWAVTSGTGSHLSHIVWMSLLVVAGLLLLFFGLGTALSCVRVLGSGIRVVNPASVREYAWEDITGFTLGRWGPFPRICLIQMADGTTNHAWGISGGNPAADPDAARAAHPIDELNALLAATRQQP